MLLVVVPLSRAKNSTKYTDQTQKLFLHISLFIENSDQFLRAQKADSQGSTRTISTSTSTAVLVQLFVQL